MQFTLDLTRLLLIYQSFNISVLAYLSVDLSKDVMQFSAKAMLEHVRKFDGVDLEAESLS